MPRKPRPSFQPDLFAAAASDVTPDEAGKALVRVVGAERPLSKPQREFNRLTDLIERKRLELAEWHAMQDNCQRRAAADFEPERRKLLALQRDTVLWIDAFLAAPPPGERLTKKPKQKLKFLLLTLAREVLGGQEDKEVEAAHDRHAPQSHAEEQREQLDFAAGMMGDVVGDHSLFEGEAETMEDLLARAAQRLQQREATEADDADSPHPPPGARGPSAREQKARAREAQAQQEASQSVREVYRRLASSLHPDRETDAAERERKTALMSRVNEAYGRNDLLALLSVQMEIEQIDADHLAGLPEARIKHYCHVLREQLQAIELELEMLASPVADALGMINGLPKPQSLLKLLDRDIEQARAACRELTRHNQLLRDARSRPDFLRRLQVDDPDEEIDPFEEMLMMQMLDKAMADMQPGPRRRRRR